MQLVTKLQKVGGSIPSRGLHNASFLDTVIVVDSMIPFQTIPESHQEGFIFGLG